MNLNRRYSMRAMVLATLIFSSLSFAGVKDASSIVRNSAGGFDVTCKAAGPETVASEDILHDDVCPHLSFGLNEGLYVSDTTYCPQNIRWNGANLESISSSPCSPYVDSFKYIRPNHYSGSSSVYPDLHYEIEVLSKTEYVFHDIGYEKDINFRKSP